MQIKEQYTKQNKNPSFALFNLSFRVFFLAATLFSITSMGLWTAVYTFQVAFLFFPLEGIVQSQWHAHEMIYGYGFAVIAGFVLTAVKNWTGVQTPYGKTLFAIFSFWAFARILFLFGINYIEIAATFDILFSFFVILAAAYPIIKTKKWMQLIILVALTLLMLFNILFYLGITNKIDNGVQLGLYGGLYLIVGLILIMGRRVVPFFIERGVDYDVSLFNSKINDIASIMLFISFFIGELLLPNSALVAFLALSLFMINSIRLIGWHTKDIWNKSLLWSLYIALWFINSGFLLFTASYFLGLSKYIAIHAFAYGGIGVITLSMMSRVALGHTGRDVAKPSKAMTYAFILLTLGAITRILMPLILPSYYLVWIGLSQLFWISAFVIFVILYLPILVKPRIDNTIG